MHVGIELWLFAIALGASLLGGLLGMASGIFVVPILTMFFRIDIHTAIGASIISVIACSCGSAAPFLKARLTNVRLAIVLEVATTLGALCGVIVGSLISTPVLYFIFAVVLLFSAQQMLARRRERLQTSPERMGKRPWTLELNSTYPDSALGRDIHYSIQRLPLGMTLMYGAGLLSALLGIGSGVLKIPAMDIVLRLPIKVSSATSNFMIGVTAAASAAAYFVRGDIVTAVAAPIAVGSVLGAAMGARILMRVSNEKLRVMFVCVLVALGAQMLLAAIGVDLLGAHRGAP
jgi:uncharacterized protein